MHRRNELKNIKKLKYTQLLYIKKNIYNKREENLKE